jgi:hypothetical protein
MAAVTVTAGAATMTVAATQTLMTAAATVSSLVTDANDTVAASATTFTRSQLKASATAAVPLFAFAGKVVCHSGSTEGRFWLKAYLRSKHCKNSLDHDVTMRYAQCYYDPTIGAVFQRDDVTSEHESFLEDLLARGIMAHFVCVGRLIDY